MKNRLRPTKELLYEKIYLEYKNKNKTIEKPKKIIGELKRNDKTITYIVCVLKGIRFGLQNTANKINKELINEYNKEIQKLEKDNTTLVDKSNKWANIMRNVEYYFTYKKHMAHYKRNKALILLCTCMYAENANELLKLKYIPNSETIEDDQNYFIKSIRKLLIDGRWVSLNDKIYNGLVEYCDTLEDNEQLFCFNLSRLCKVIERIAGSTLTQIRDEYSRLHTINNIFIHDEDCLIIDPVKNH